MIRMIGTGTGVSKMETAILIATPQAMSLMAALISQDMNQEVNKATVLRITLLRYTGCPKKNAILCLMGHRGHLEWTRDKSRVSFENLRKFPF